MRVSVHMGIVKVSTIVNTELDGRRTALIWECLGSRVNLLNRHGSAPYSNYGAFFVLPQIPRTSTPYTVDFYSLSIEQSVSSG